MNYREAVRYLQDLGNEVLGMKFGLETIRGLMQALGNPQQQYPSVLIAGTNGKGSVAYFLNSILQSARIRSGLYTSPQVVCLQERIVTEGRQISARQLAAGLNRVVQAIPSAPIPQPPTFFETLTALAFDHFARQSIELAVLEVGMGGRLDSTNVVEPLISILTPIGMDHRNFLGDTIEEIAGEKAGILRRRTPILSAPQQPQARRVFQQRAAALSAPLFELDAGMIQEVNPDAGCYRFSYRGLALELGVQGAHQMENAALAVEAALGLRRQEYAISDRHIQRGIQRARFPGRMEKVASGPDIYIDGGHNREAAERVAEFVRRHMPQPRSLIFSMLVGKDIRGVAELYRPLFDQIVLVPLDSPRAARLEDLQSALPEAQTVLDLPQALSIARSGAAAVLASGSFTLAGAIRSRFQPEFSLGSSR